MPRRQSSRRKKNEAEREQPLLVVLETRGFAGGAQKITKSMLEAALKSEGQKAFGSREALILRLAQFWDVEIEDEGEEDEGSVDADEACEDEDEDDEEEAAAAAEAAPEPMVAAEVDAHQQLVNEAKAALAAASQVDMELIQELLAGRTPSMKNWWQEQDKLVE